MTLTKMRPSYNIAYGVIQYTPHIHGSITSDIIFISINTNKSIKI